ncbi:DUF3891 family protein [Lentibacillus sp. CBA3610]|uniref:DUF3891 family protein n=1 Tax=Lentibacillus sp. CBA3610 TaxID=2518176 RepID=UPI001597F4A3|nr:DUF3891 family protein [Lentibacillus sp. CBA3610]QKY71047.1 DUF3891 family protein [Lentibacillus sp. CBA3610]
MNANGSIGLFSFWTIIDEHIFHVHRRGLLHCLTSLSLYILFNEPGALKENEHPFFKEGIPVSAFLTFFHTNKINIYWKDEKSVEMDVFPFNSQVNITIRQKSVPKKAIAENGLIESYEQAEEEAVSVQLL